MYEIYEKQRAHIDTESTEAVKQALEYAKIRAEGAIEAAVNRQEVLHRVTHNYFKRGYHLIDKYNGRIGQYRNENAYVKRLARQMKRPYVQVDISGYAAWYANVAKVIFPKAAKYAPLYAEFLLLAEDGPEFDYQNRPTKPTIRKRKCTHVTAFDLYTPSLNNDGGKKHPLIYAWMQRAETDPEWRALLMGNFGR